MGLGQIIAKGFLEHQDFDLQRFTFIITPAFSNIGWNIHMGDDRDLLKEKSKVFRIFFPQNEPLYLSLTHAEQRPSLCDWQWRRIKWHFLTFKKHLLISTRCTISLMLLLSVLPQSKKKKAGFCSLWNISHTVFFSVASPHVLKRRGKSWFVVCIQLLQKTGGLEIPDIRSVCIHKIY